MHPGILFTIVIRDHDQRRRQRAIERDAQSAPIATQPLVATPAAPSTPVEHAVPPRRLRQGARL